MKPFLFAAIAFCLTFALHASAAAPINKKCPVEGEDVDTSLTTTYKGKTVAFCCKGCDKEFAKDPEKFMKVLADKGDDNSAKGEKGDEGAKGEKGEKKPAGPVNKMCPVHSDREVDVTVTSEFNGKIYGFCCEDCQKKFDADPEKYAKKIEKGEKK